MKRLFVFALVCAAATTTFARPPMPAPFSSDAIQHQAQYSPTPTPMTITPPAPGTVVGGAIVHPSPVLSPIPANMEPGVIICDSIAAPHIALYPKVRVVQSRKIAPCAVSKLVSVPDPCNPCNVVFITICVPPCVCETIECVPRKNRTVFNYGKYAVKVTERHGTLVVNYDN